MFHLKYPLLFWQHVTNAISLNMHYNTVPFLDGPSLFEDEDVIPTESNQLSMDKSGVPEANNDLKSKDYLQLLQQVSVLQEKLAEKEKSELGLIEEKNKLLKIVKEYNQSLANERDCLKEKIIDQDQTIQVWYFYSRLPSIQEGPVSRCIMYRSVSLCVGRLIIAVRK